MTVLFTGMTGVVGQAIAQELANFPISARAMVRDPGKAESLRGAGVAVVKGDLEDVGSVRNALDGADKAFLLMANAPNQAQLEKQFIETAAKNGVSHVVKMSAIGADPTTSIVLKRFHGEGEAHLEASGMSYTHIRPNFFMQNLLHAAQSICEQDKFVMPMGKGEVGTIDVRDVATVVLAALTDKQHENRCYDISGPELLSFRQIAQQLSDVLGRKIDYVDIPIEDFKRDLAQWSPGQWYVDSVSELFQATAANASAQINDTVEELCGSKPRTVRAFVKDHAAAFGATQGS